MACRFSNQPSAFNVAYYIGDFSSLSVGDCSFGIWLRDTGVPGWGNFGLGYDRIWDVAYNTGFAMLRNGTAASGVAYRAGNPALGQSMGSFTVNSWDLFILTFNATTGDLLTYLNSSTPIATTNVGTGSITIGAFGIGNNNTTNPNAEPWLGDLAEVMFFDSVLTGANVATLHTTPPITAGLTPKHYWPIRTAANTHTDSGSSVSPITLSQALLGTGTITDTDHPYVSGMPVFTNYYAQQIRQAS